MLTSKLLEGLNHCFTERSDYFCEERIDFYTQMLCVEGFIRPKQIHGDYIEIDPMINEGFEADAVILTKKGRGLVMNFADCTPIILFDPVLNIAAGVHAGWRGTAAKIAQKTAQKMIELGSKPENIRAAIGPCISKCCFEVSKEVVDALQPYTVFEPKGEKFMVDLKETNRRQLEEVGIREFDILPNCTACDQDKFFSYRLTKTPYRHNIILALK